MQAFGSHYLAHRWRMLMHRSEKRILTTHAGSLPRRQKLVEMLAARSRGEKTDTAALEG